VDVVSASVSQQRANRRRAQRRWSVGRRRNWHAANLNHSRVGTHKYVTSRRIDGQLT
jgi:hypothetical protein